MALLFMDGFEWLQTTTNATCVYTYAAFYNNTTGKGRFGSRGVYFDSAGRGIGKSIPSRTTIYLGVANKMLGTPTYSSAYPFVDFRSGGVTQVRGHFKSQSSFAFYNGSGTQIGTDITIPNVYDRYRYLEFKITISDTVGEIIFKIDGVEYYHGTNLDTRNGTPTDIDYITIYEIYSSTNNIDDLYIDDAQFHGDVRIRAVFPDANGSVNNFSVYPSGSNYQAVDEVPLDYEATYNYANTVGNIDLYGVTAPVLGIVKAVGVKNAVRKDDAGIRTIKNLCRSGGSNYQGSEFSVEESYYTNYDIWETDPQDSNPWTKEKIDAAEFGLEITA